MKALTSIFVKGLATVLPVAITIYLTAWLIFGVERGVRYVLPQAWQFPGAGWLIALAVIFGAGLLMQIYLFEAVFGWATGLLNRVPVVRSVFNAIQDFFALIGKNGKSQLSSVVRVKLGPDLSVIGFVTNRNPAQLAPGLDDENLVAVYLPMSYQIGGYTIFVPADRLQPLDLNPEQALKVILTAGLSVEK